MPSGLDTEFWFPPGGASLLTDVRPHCAASVQAQPGHARVDAGDVARGRGPRRGRSLPRREGKGPPPSAGSRAEVGCEWQAVTAAPLGEDGATSDGAGAEERRVAK